MHNKWMGLCGNFTTSFVVPIHCTILETASFFRFFLGGGGGGGKSGV